MLVAAGAMAASGCGGEPGTSLHFRVVDNGAVLGCGGPEPRTLPGLAFFVSDVAVIDAEGDRNPVLLPDSPPWQSAGVALIKPLGDECRPATINARLDLAAAVSHAERIEFTVGIPQGLNHADPLRAEAPLSDMRMHWSWRTGYKFLRLDAVGGGGEALTLHIGATGCRSPAPVRPPAEACSRPNRAVVRLPYTGASMVVDVDIGALASATGGAPAHCIGAYHEDTTCAALLARFGLDAASGRCSDGCSAQSVFVAGDPP